jgi:hypothetical protein
MKYTKENYEEFAIEYLEGSMSRADRNSFEHFLDLNPALKKEITGLQIVKLPPFEASFPKKNLLLKPANRHRFYIPLYLRSLAAAILFLCIMAIFWYWNGNTDGQLAVDQKTIQTEPANTKNIPVTSDEQQALPAVQESLTDIKQIATINLKTNGKEDTKEIKNLREENTDLIASTPQTAIEPVVLKESGVIPTQDDVNPDIGQGFREPTKAVAILNQIEIKPSSDALTRISVAISVSPDHASIDQENRSKFGQLLANLNLLPTGLREELEVGGLRDKIIPESYRDTKL